MGIYCMKVLNVFSQNPLCPKTFATGAELAAHYDHPNDCTALDYFDNHLSSAGKNNFLSLVVFFLNFIY